MQAFLSPSSSVYFLFLTTRVQLFYVFNSSCCSTQDLPQSFIVVTLFFLFYIISLANSVMHYLVTALPILVIALFAYDVSILTTAWKKKDPKPAAQSAIDFVFD